MQLIAPRPPLSGTRPRRVRAAERGFTLIEVLVAVLVLSFGMLGVVGLQVAAMQANREAKNQSAGVRYARELAEAMRANKVELARATGNIYLAVDSTSAVPAAFSCANTGCATRAELANQDVSDWWLRANAEFRGLRVRVCQDAAPYSAAGVPVWDCTAPASSVAGQSIFIKMAWTQQSTNRADTAAFIRATNPLIVVPVTN